MRIFTCITVALVFSSAANADRIDELEKRIETLQRQQEEALVVSEENRGAVRSFLNDNLALGGFFEPSMTLITGPDTRTQAAQSSNLLAINLAAAFTPRLRFSSQYVSLLSFPMTNEQLPSRAFGTVNLISLVAQGYLEYRSRESFTIQGGFGYVPFGYSHQQRDLTLFQRRGGPQLLRTAGIANLFWSGVHVFGFFPTESGNWGYNAYTFTPVTQPGVPGVGARAWWSAPKDYLIIGLSSQVGKRGWQTYEAFAADARLRIRDVSITSEYARTFIQGDDPWSVYIEPSLPVSESVLIYVFGDYANGPVNTVLTGTAEIIDPVSKWEYGAGVNWLPVSATRLRLGVTYHDYIGAYSTPGGLSRDYTSVDASAGIAF